MSEKIKNPREYLSDIFTKMKNPLADDETIFKLAEKLILLDNQAKGNDGFNHLHDETYENQKIEHVLCLNSELQISPRLAALFCKKCQERNLPYNLKFSGMVKRDDSFVVYSDTEHLADYIEILREIFAEKPEYLDKIGEPPEFTGKIDKRIGYCAELQNPEEPCITTRSNMLSNIFNEQLKTFVINNLDTQLNDSGTKISDVFKKDIMNAIYATLKAQSLTKMSDPKELELFIDQNLKEIILAAFKETDKIHTEEEKESLYPDVSERNIFAALATAVNTLSTKDKDYGYLFFHNNNIGDTLSLTLNTCATQILDNPDLILKFMDDKFLKNVRSEIARLSPTHGIDSNSFYFDTTTKDSLKHFGVSFETPKKHTSTEITADKIVWLDNKIKELTKNLSTLSDPELQLLKFLKEQKKNIETSRRSGPTH